MQLSVGTDEEHSAALLVAAAEALLTAQDPKVPSDFVSGLPKDIAVSKGLIAEDALLVKKPFTSDLLLEALRLVLSEKA